MNIKIQKEELLPYLRDRFGKRLRPEVSSVMMVQTENEVYLEYSLNSNPGKVNKVDLNFIAYPIKATEQKIASVPGFNSKNDLIDNIHLFLSETDDYTIILAIDQIFTPDGIENIIDNSVDY